jgi:hypothetical protein
MATTPTRDRTREEGLFRRIGPAGAYAFLHDDARFHIDRGRITARTIVTPDVGLTGNVFDYCLLIEKAAEIHVIDSAFMHLIDLLPDFGQKLFFHRCARPTKTWQLPSLKKNWMILT